MKTNFNVFSFIIISALFLFNSCSNDDELGLSNSNNDNKEQPGRFDNKPFVWDAVYSVNNQVDDIFIGDVSIQVSDGLSPIKGSKGSSGRPPSSPRRVSTGNSESVSDNISIINPAGIYVGAVYPESSLPYKFDREITKPRNPIDLIFEFSSPFFANVTKETGSLGYKQALKDATKSADYRTHVNNKVKGALSYSMTEFNSYKDLEKGFSANTSFGALFSAQVKVNASQVKKEIKGKLFARLTSSNFTVYMDTPSESMGFFKSTEDNANKVRDGKNVYIRSITYGKVVYVAIESEYSYNEVKFAVEASVKAGFGSASISANQKITEVLSKSAITIFAISDNSSDSYFMDGIKNLEKLFEANYTEYSYGFPIFIQGRYTHNNGSYFPTGGSNTTTAPGRGSSERG